MRTHNSNLKNLLLTASIVSTAAFLTGCGDNANTSGVKATGTEVREANQAALVAGVAGADADAATREALAAAAKAKGLKPAEGAVETAEQKAAREAAEAEAKEKLRLAEAAERKRAEADARAAKEAAEAAAAKKLASARAVAEPVKAFVAFLDSKGWTLDPAFLTEAQVSGMIAGDVANSTMVSIVLKNAVSKTDATATMPIATRGSIQEEFKASLAAPAGDPKPVDPPKPDDADPLSDAMLNKPATGADSYGLTEGDDGTLAKAVVKVKDVAAFRSVFGIMGIAEPPKPPMGDPFTQLLNAALTPDLKSALINAKSDADYTPIIVAAAGNAVFAGAVPEEHRLRFFKIVRAKAIAAALEPAAELALSSGSVKGLADLSGKVSFRDARTSLSGRVDGRGLSVNGVNGQAVELAMPLFVNVKGNVDSAKATEAATGSVAYRLGNTVIGAIQGYANSGAGFELDGHQLESSVVASHSFGGLFIEGQAGSVAAASVHGSDWNGVRSQFTVGFDTSIVSPFVQVAYRQLDRDGIVGEKDTAAYVGVDMEVANLTADTYSLNTRLLTKVGYGEKNLSSGTKDLGSTVGVRGSVEWTAGVNLNSGISFSTNLGLDTLSGSSAGVKVGLDR